MTKKMITVAAIIVGVAVVGMVIYFFWMQLGNPGRLLRFRQWMSNPATHPEWSNKAGAQCGSAPFIFPTDGMVGFLWGDSFRLGHQHQGIDIFGGNEIGKTPVVAAFDGYLTRQTDWKSSVIIRIPNDPLQPGRQIWTYYTHMANEKGNSFISNQFPPGTLEMFVKAGTLLGYQGDYSGDPNNPVGVHLHFSIVKDDGFGHYLNELEIRNTYDPSPYFSMVLNGKSNKDRVPVCLPNG
jgi:peptidoglycan LD-endopeptidase LytH